MVGLRVVAAGPSEESRGAPPNNSYLVDRLTHGVRAVRVIEAMRAHVIQTTPDATLRDVVDLMDLYQVSGLPVVEGDGRLVGIVTEHDVIEALLKPYVHGAPEGGAELGALVREVRGRLVREAMKTPVVSIDESADVLDAASLMLSHRIKRLPVTSEGRLVGVIGRIDICQAILEDTVGGAAEPGEL